MQIPGSSIQCQSYSTSLKNLVLLTKLLSLLFLPSFWDTTISNFLPFVGFFYQLLIHGQVQKMVAPEAKAVFAFSCSHTTQSLCITGNTLWLQLQSLSWSQVHSSALTSPCSQFSHRQVNPKLLLVKGSVPFTWCFFFLEIFYCIFSY